MRQNALYISFILVMVLILILINKKPTTYQPVSGGKIQQQISNNENPSLLGSGQPLIRSSDKPGVTLIRKTINKSSLSEESLLSSEEKQPAKQVSVQSASSSGTSENGVSTKPESVAKEEPSGITPTSKRPAEKEKQQLREKGILLL